MSRVHLNNPHPRIIDVPDEFEPGSLPVEPDEGPVPDHIPSDPEDDRVIAPELSPGGVAESTRGQVEVAECP